MLEDDTHTVYYRRLEMLLIESSIVDPARKCGNKVIGLMTKNLREFEKYVRGNTVIHWIPKLIPYATVTSWRRRSQKTDSAIIVIL
ncbi:MAG: hypothetical protein AYK18_08025 [Theionarchaea archaeon DG-70]|nr:MAG: hypothetical protein AYK18_08025 [Theionarchaea archaeon DG-70]